MYHFLREYIDCYALHPPAILRQQCPERQQIVPVDQQIACPRIAVGLLFIMQQQSRLDFLHGLVLARPCQFPFRHCQENHFYTYYHTTEGQSPLSWLGVHCIWTIKTAPSKNVEKADLCDLGLT